MNYVLAKELKDAGFPQHGNGGFHSAMPGAHDFYTPTLEELIEACGEKFRSLERHRMAGKIVGWAASRTDTYDARSGVTPTEAVARLWLALNPPRNMKKKRIIMTAWAVVFNYESLVTPQVFSTKLAANTFRDSRTFKDNFSVVPCTITYELPLTSLMKEVNL